jgi:sterol 14-demethylase
MFSYEYFAKWGQHGMIDLKHELSQVLMLISGRCLLGKEIREKMLDEFYTLFREVENGLNLVNLVFPYIPIPDNRRRDSARIKLKEILSKTLRSRRSFGKVGEDTLQKLIDSKYKDGRSTTEEEITGLIIALVFVGKHTSSHTSAWTGACLLDNAKCLEVVIEEQKQIIGKFGGEIDYNVLLEMTALHWCIKEALRLHPATPILVRKTHKHFNLFTKEGNEYTIPAGHTLVSPIMLNNNIPSIYKDPQVYDPERFGPGREEDKVGGEFSYTSFSGGRHACPGEAYSYMQIKVILSHLLRNFELQLVSPFPKAERGKFALEPQGKVMVSYQRRKLLGT